MSSFGQQRSVSSTIPTPLSDSDATEGAPAYGARFHTDADERTELDALRVENDTLRRNLGRLEEKVQRAEETALKEQELSQAPEQGNNQGDGGIGWVSTNHGSSATLEVHHLEGILQWLHVSMRRDLPCGRNITSK